MKNTSAIFILFTIATPAVAAGAFELQTITPSRIAELPLTIPVAVPAPEGTLQGFVAAVKLKSISLQAADGARLTIDYNPLSLDNEIAAAPLWVTVAAPWFNGSEKVRAVLMNYYDRSNTSANILKDTQTIDLQFNGVAFQAEGRRVQLLISHLGYIGYDYNFRQEIAVVVNGRWLTDPVNGTHNFKFKMGL